MRVMVDANIIISAGLFPESVVGKTLEHIAKNESLVICKYTLEELSEVFFKKFPKRVQYFYHFMDNLRYELVDYEVNDTGKYPKIRDPNDLPILINAIESKVDLLITGDKDFEEIDIEKPKIMKPREYEEKYIKQ